MNTLLIVEDEKMIRQGIRAIAERSGVEIKEVLECKNGAEAMKILKSTPVDVMISDICMPVMDGMELVREASVLTHKPLIIVVSGYDEFSYALSVFRDGVRDYLVKPISRLKLTSLLKALDVEITAKIEQAQRRRMADVHLVKLLMQNRLLMEEKQALSAQLGLKKKFEGDYTLICLPAGVSMDLPEGDLYIREINGHSMLISFGPVNMERYRHLCAGVSGVYQGAESLSGAYGKAVALRQASFMRGEMVADLAAPPAYETINMNQDIGRIIRYMGTYNYLSANQAIGQIVMKAQNRIISPESFETVMGQIIQEIAESFSGQEQARQFETIWAYKDIYEYYTAFCGWVETFCTRLKNDADGENRRRIMRAALYLQDNFLNDVDMAMVSNYISMNYTQFSHLFKQYTGRNFLEYLKDLRIEESKRLLDETDLLIKDVCVKSGFKNEKHFMKVFKQSTGVSPSDYRKIKYHKSTL